MNRRGFLSLLVISFSSTLYSLHAKSRTIQEQSNSILYGHIESYFSDLDSSRKIGDAYMQLTENRVTESTLITNIVNPNVVTGEKYLTQNEFKTLMRKRITSDFEEERVVVLDGWVLSTTEVSMCAIVALT